MAAGRAEYLPPARRSLRAVILLATVLAAVLLSGFAAVRHYFERQIAAGIEQKLAEHFPHVRWYVGDVQQTSRGLLLSDVRANLPASSQRETEPLLSIHQVRLEGELGTDNLVLGTSRLDRMVLLRPRIHVHRDTAGHWNLEHLRPVFDRENLPKPPEVRIVDGQLQLTDSELQGMGRFVVDNLQLRLAPEADVSATAWRLEGNATSRYFESFEILGQLDFATDHWNASAAARSLEVSNLLLGLLPADALAGILQADTRLLCHTNLDLQLAGRLATPTAAGDGGIRLPRFEPLSGGLQAQVLDGKLEDARLPYPVGGLQATIHWDQNGLAVTDIAAHCGTARLAGFYQQSATAELPERRLKLSAYQLRVDAGLIARLPEDLQKPLTTFSPVGTVDIHWSSESGSHADERELVVAVHDASFRYAKFPYALDGAEGLIRLKNDTLTMEGFKAHAHGQALSVVANIDQPFKQPRGWLRLAASGPVPIDDELMGALDPRSEALLRSLSPTGQLLLEEALFQYNGQQRPKHRRLIVHLSQAAIRYEAFPYPVDRIDGTFRLNDDIWTLENLTGVHAGAFVRCAGSWQAGTTTPNLALDLSVNDMPLDDDLRDAIGTLDLKTWQFWNSLNPSGSIDQLSVSIRRGPGDERAHLSLAAEKFRVRRQQSNGIRIKPSWFPYPLTNLCGAISYHRGTLVMSDMRAEHGSTVLRLDGRGRLEPNGDWSVNLENVAADNLVADYDLISALPGSLGPALAAMDIQGSFLVNGQLQLGHREGDQRSIHADWNVTIDTAGGMLGGKMALGKVFGGIRLQGRHNDRESFSRGELEIDSVQIKNQQLTSLEGPIWIEQKQLLMGRWVPPRSEGDVARPLVGTYADGAIELAAHVNRADTSQFLLVAQLLNGDLSHFSQQPVVGGPLGGRVDAQLQLTGQLGAVHSLRGLGHVRLRKADIERTPLIMAVSQLLAAAEPTGSNFTSAEIDLRIQSDHLHLEDIRLNGDAVSLRGSGWMNVDREIDLKLYTAVGRGEIRVPIVSTVLAEASRSLMEINVVGKLDQPQIKRTAFPDLDDTMQRILADLEETLPGRPPTTAQPRGPDIPLRR